MSFAQIDSDGNHVGAFGPGGLDDARLRRAQAMALTNGVGLEIAKGLIRKRLKGQIEVLSDEFAGSAQAIPTIILLCTEIDDTRSIDELRRPEAQAANTYWRYGGILLSGSIEKRLPRFQSTGSASALEALRFRNHPHVGPVTPPTPCSTMCTR